MHARPATAQSNSDSLMLLSSSSTHSQNTEDGYQFNIKGYEPSKSSPYFNENDYKITEICKNAKNKTHPCPFSRTVHVLSGVRKIITVHNVHNHEPPGFRNLNHSEFEKLVVPLLKSYSESKNPSLYHYVLEHLMENGITMTQDAFRMAVKRLNPLSSSVGHDEVLSMMVEYFPSFLQSLSLIRNGMSSIEIGLGTKSSLKVFSFLF